MAWVQTALDGDEVDDDDVMFRYIDAHARKHTRSNAHKQYPYLSIYILLSGVTVLAVSLSLSGVTVSC